MWRSGSDTPGRPKLPAASDQLVRAKADRADITTTSYFGQLTKSWKPVVRQRVAAEEMPIDDSHLPAYLRHRPTVRKQTLFFRTGPGTRGKKK